MALGIVLLTVPLSIIVIYAVKLFFEYTHHLAEAQATGIPYVKVPFYHSDRIQCIICLPLLRRLPTAWTNPWLDLIDDWFWKARHEQFQKISADTFLAVAPSGIRLCTADADVITQITSRRDDFPKPIKDYGLLKIYGDNVLTLEGERWRLHRKITSPPFSEKNNHLVWQESLIQTQAMLRSWLKNGNNGSQTLTTIADDAMRLTLHVISKAGFGVPLAWPGASKGGITKQHDHGHSMSYAAALSTLVAHILWVLVCPHFILKHLPSEIPKKAYTSFVEWGNYITEIFEKKKIEVLCVTSSDQSDLMISMIKGANVTSDPTTQTLNDREIMGNSFVFLLAGTETTANSIHFCLVCLALHTASQRRLQRDLDSIFHGKPPESWDYARDFPKLSNSMVGAVLNEELRILAPVNCIPKCTLPDSPQLLNIGGKKYLIPGDTSIQLVTPAVHRNPKFWPTSHDADQLPPSRPFCERHDDLEEFKPERWILDTEAKRTAAKALYQSLGTNPNSDKVHAPDSNPHSDTPHEFYKPPKGAFIPFSEGHRSCIGRRFAQVELMAVVALIFSRYSVELAVDEWATDEEVEKMDLQQKGEVWKMAREKVERQLRDDMGSVITMQLRKGFFALRLVNRGCERFDW